MISKKHIFFTKLIYILAFVSLLAKPSLAEVFRIIDDSVQIDNEHILIVTTRAISTENEVELREEPGSAVTYLKAYFDQGQWYFDVEENLNELMQNRNTYIDYTIYLHGDSKTFFNVAHQALEMQKLHQTNVILYSWPSKNPEMNGIKNFKNSRQIVEATAQTFVDFVHDMQEFRESSRDSYKVTLFAHSLGNYYLETGVRQGLFDQLEGSVFDNLVMNAAAVNQKGHYEWVEKLNIQQRLYITSNDKDFILSGVRVFSDWGTQLGEKAKKPHASNAMYIDFTKAIGFRSPFWTTHSYYMDIVADESDNIKIFYTTLFHGEPLDLNDSKSFQSRTNGLGYAILFENLPTQPEDEKLEDLLVNDARK